MTNPVSFPAVPDSAEKRLDPLDLEQSLSDGIDLRQIMAVLRANVMWIAIVMAVALAAGVITTMLQTRLYAATATVQIDNEAARVLKGAEEEQNASSAYDTDRFLNTQLDVLRSRAVGERVVDRLKLIDNPRFLNEVGGGSPLNSVSRDRLKDIAIRMVRGRMTVSLPRQSRVATITVVTADSRLSAEIANAYAIEFIQANLQRKFESSDYARGFLSEQLASAKARLEESERELNNYAREAGLIRTPTAARSGGSGNAGGSGELSVTATSLIQLNAAANDAREKRIEAESRWRAVASGDALNTPEVLSNNAVQSLLTKRAEAEAALREARARHLDEHPNVIRLQAQLNAYTQQLNSVVTGVRNGLQQEYRAALGAEQELNSQVSALKAETMQEQDRSVAYGILAREADTNRTLYDGLLQRYKELTAAAGISNSNISLVDRAQVPNSPSSPNLLVNLAYALFAGLVLSAILVVIRLQLDDGVRVPEDVEHKLGLPVLGIVPKLHEGNPFEQLADPKSSLSEAYNSLRGSIGFATAEGAPRLLLVTSASASEGKSTTSYALARGFAKLGRKVLLVDVDMRRPSTHRQFDASNDVGLSSVLVGQSTFGDAVRKSPFENLSYLTSGPIPPSPTELLASARMLALLEELRASYDIVVLDSPPILGLADAPLLSSLAEGTLLVLESDRNRRGVLRGTLRRMKLAHGRVIGVALTKFDASLASNYTYYYGYDYYSYGGGERRRRSSNLVNRIRQKLQAVRDEANDA